MAKHLTKSFGRWLLLQVWRDNSMGDFARQAVRSRRKWVGGEPWFIGHASIVDYDAWLCRRYFGRRRAHILCRMQLGLRVAWRMWEQAMTAPASPRACVMCGEETGDRGIFYPAGPYLRGRRVLPICRNHPREVGKYAGVEYCLSH